MTFSLILLGVADTSAQELALYVDGVKKTLKQLEITLEERIKESNEPVKPRGEYETKEEFEERKAKRNISLDDFKQYTVELKSDVDLVYYVDHSTFLLRPPLNSGIIDGIYWPNLKNNNVVYMERKQLAEQFKDKLAVDFFETIKLDLPRGKLNLGSIDIKKESGAFADICDYPKFVSANNYRWGNTLNIKEYSADYFNSVKRDIVTRIHLDNDQSVLKPANANGVSNHSNHDTWIEYRTISTRKLQNCYAIIGLWCCRCNGSHI